MQKKYFIKSYTYYGKTFSKLGIKVNFPNLINIFLKVTANIILTGEKF